MICNWCRLSLVEIASQVVNAETICTYECTCLPLFLEPNIIPTGVKSTMIIKKNDSISYYDIYYIMDDTTYNIEGTFDYTSIILLKKEDMTEVCKIPFYVPTSDHPTRELIDLSTKIIKLKAFT